MRSRTRRPDGSSLNNHRSSSHHIIINHTKPGRTVFFMCIFLRSTFLTQELSLPVGPWSKPFPRRGSHPRRIFSRVAIVDGSKKESIEFEPYLISSGLAIDARDWDESMLREYQTMVVGNRRMAEDSYSLACNQSNAMMAISGVVLAMIIPFLSDLSGTSCWIAISASICMALSVGWSTYTGIKSRRVICTAPVGSLHISSSKVVRQMIIASINSDLTITDSHIKANESKRASLNHSLFLFCLGIALLIVAAIAHLAF